MCEASGELWGSRSIGRLTNHCPRSLSVEASLLFAVTLHSGVHSNITAGDPLSLHLLKVFRKWLTLYLNIRSPFFHQGWGKGGGRGVRLFSERWSARLPVQRWDLHVSVQAGVQLHAQATCLVAWEHTAPEGEEPGTAQSLLPPSAFYIFLTGRSTPEISSTYAVKGTFKSQ